MIENYLKNVSIRLTPSLAQAFFYFLIGVGVVIGIERQNTMVFVCYWCAKHGKWKSKTDPDSDTDGDGE